MQKIGVQTHNIIYDDNPYEGFKKLADAGFSCCDFSLNMYLKNKEIYQKNINHFFDKSIEELQEFFSTHKKAAKENGITINQMHMPYPIYIPNNDKQNDYMIKTVAVKSMQICAFFECRNIVIHGFKLARYLGSEEYEWEKTKEFIKLLAPFAKENGITICFENLYDGIGGHLVEGPGCDPYKAVQRIDEINSEYGAEVLGFCFDTGHANILGIDMENFITTLGKRIKVLHIHDNDGIADLHQIPFTFTRTRENHSSTDWEGFLNGLKKIGYDGVLSFETAPVLSAFPREMSEAVLKFIASVGSYMWTKIDERSMSTMNIYDE